MRDEFTQATKNDLARRSGFLCSNPDCRQLTVGPLDARSGSFSIGEAAHISGASPLGPRYDPSLTSAQRSHADNGIWVCSNCSDLIDKDEAAFPPDVLRAWRTLSENEARLSVANPRPPKPDLRPILDKLGRYLDVYEKLERECIQKRGSREVHDKALRYYNEVWQYLHDNVDGGAAGQFKAATLRGLAPANYPSSELAIWSSIGGRKEYLSQLVGQLRAKL